MLATYLIGLREGLEATLVVSILVAFLVKSERKDRLKLVWAGVAAAVVLSVIFGWLLSYTETTLLQDYKQQELFEAVTSIAAICFVTWMIFWMRRAARGIAGELRNKLQDALAVGSLAVGFMAFLAVVREGLETSLIVYAAVQGADVLDPSAWYTALLTGMFNITPEPTVLEVIAWAAYGVPVLVLFLWPARKAKPSVPAASPAATPAPQA